MTSCVELLTDLVDWGLPVLAGLTLSVFTRVHTARQFSGVETQLWVSKRMPLVISPSPNPIGPRSLSENNPLALVSFLCVEEMTVY